MKEIWINFELYFESYEFSNFRDFFRIFLKLFLIFQMIKTIKKGAKTGFIFARDSRGTKGHMAEPGGPTRARAWREGDTWHEYLFLLITIRLLYI